MSCAELLAPTGSELELKVDLSRTALDAMRRALPEIVAAAVREIVREVPEYAAPDCVPTLQSAVRMALGHFVELIGRAAQPSPATLEYFRRIGALEARQGRGVQYAQRALPTGARVAVHHLTRAVARQAVPTTTYGQITAAIFPYLGRLTAAIAEGHAVEPPGDQGGARRRLAERLVQEPGADITEPAGQARWPIPRQIAAILLPQGEAQQPVRLPPDVLDGRHLPVPVLLVPDPDGPGRREALAAGLRGRTAAMGPAVPVGELAESLGWARQALDLVERGVIARPGLVVAVDHLAELIIARRQDLIGRVAIDRLEPLTRARPHQRYALAQTLEAYLECGFKAVDAAKRLRLHPQTVRYRLRALEKLFGEQMYAPELNLEFLIVLRAWLIENRPGR
jgi:hypothetical protein